MKVTEEHLEALSSALDSVCMNDFRSAEKVREYRILLELYKILSDGVRSGAFASDLAP